MGRFLTWGRGGSALLRGVSYRDRSGGYEIFGNGVFIMNTESTVETVGLVSEAELAESLGVPLARVREARLSGLSPEETKKRGRRVLLDQAAVVRLSGLLAVEGAADGILEKKGRPELVEIRVRKVPLNPRMVFGELVKGGDFVRVRVRDSRKFVPGMVLRGRFVDGDVYVLEGRGPRFRGRW